MSGAFSHSVVFGSIYRLPNTFKWLLVGQGCGGFFLSTAVAQVAAVAVWYTTVKKYPDRASSSKIFVIPDTSEQERRIKKIKSGNPTLSKETKKSYRRLVDRDDYLPLGNEKKLVLERAFAIRDELKDTHYVFFHAQSSDFLPLIYASKVAGECLEFNKGDSSFSYLRFPWALNEEPHNLDIDNVNDHVERESLLSVDLLNDGKASESSFSFLDENRNALGNNTEIYKSLFSHLSKELFNLDLSDNAATTLAITRLQALSNRATTAHLALISIPKSVVLNEREQLVYKAHDFGSKCTHYTDEEAYSLIERVQNNEEISGSDNSDDDCQDSKCGFQYRVIIKRLTPNKGRIDLATSLSKEDRNSLKDEVKKIIEEWKETLSKNI